MCESIPGRDGAAALALLEEALAILDELDLPGDIDARLDQTICRLRDVLGLQDRGVDDLDCRAG